MVEDKRAFPRVDLEFAVAIRTTDGKVLRSTALNISRGGLQLDADATVVRALAPQQGDQPPLQVEPVILSFSVELPEGPATVKARAELVHLDRAAGEKFIVGFRFKAFGKGCYASLERFIEESLRY